MRTVVAPRSRAAAATRAYSASCSRSRARASGCSRISARSFSPGSAGAAGTGSGDDTGLAADEDAVDLEVVVEHDDVGGQTGLEATDRREPDDLRRHGASRFERLGERHA